MRKGPFVVVDLETTGFDPKVDEIIEIGAVRWENGVITDTFQRFVCPNQPVPLAIQQLTGITTAMLQDSPSIDEVMPAFFEFVDGHPLFAHNADFEEAFIQEYSDRKTLGIFCTLELSQLVLPTAPSYGLAALSRYLGLELDEHHRALADAKATAQLLTIIFRQMDRLTNELGPLWLAMKYLLGPRLLAMINTLELPQWQFKLQPKVSPAAEGLFEEEPERGKKRRKKPNSLLVESDPLASLLAENGPFVRQLPGFSPRPQRFACWRQWNSRSPVPRLR